MRLLASVLGLLVLASLNSSHTPSDRTVEAMTLSPNDESFLLFPKSTSFGAGALPPFACDEAFVRDKILGPVKVGVIGAPVTTKHFDYYFYYLTGAVSSPDLRDRMVKALASPVAADSGPITTRGTFSGYLDAVYDYYVKIGMTDPDSVGSFTRAKLQTTPSIPVTNGVRMPGVPGKIPVYVSACNGATRASPEGAIAIGLETLENDGFRRWAMPHEVFHVFQNGSSPTALPTVGLPGMPPGHIWPIEATATAMEDVIAPSARRWAQAPFNRMFQCPEEPFHDMWDLACDRHDRIGTQGNYGKFAFVKFMVKNRPGVTIPSFWNKYVKEPKLDPTKVVAPYDIAEFNLALLLDKTDLTYFDPADRSAFRVAMDPPSDFKDRYTFFIGDAAWNASKGSRLTMGMPYSTPFTPDDVRADGTPRPTLGNSTKLAEFATHRWLIKLPADALPSGLGKAFELVFDDPPTTALVSLVGLDKVGGKPAYVGDFSHKSAKFLKPGEQKLSWGGPEPHPEYLLLVITNTTAASLTYKASLSLTGRCLAQCPKGLGEFWVQKKCAVEACKLLTDPAANGACLKQQQALLAIAEDKYAKAWCPVACGAFPTTTSATECLTEKPYGRDPTLDPHRVDTILLSAGVPNTTKVGFVPLNTWPTSQLTCRDLLTGH